VQREITSSRPGGASAGMVRTKRLRTRLAARHPIRNTARLGPPDQALGGLYPTLVSCARFIAASASLAVISVVVSKRVKPPVAAAAIEHAAAAVLSSNSQIATPSYSPNEI